MLGPVRRTFWLFNEIPMRKKTVMKFSEHRHTPTHILPTTQAVNYLFPMTAAFYFAIKFENHVR